MEEHYPIPNRDYPVQITGQEINSTDGVIDKEEYPKRHHLFRYDFVPASIDHEAIGLITRNESNGIEIERKHQTNAEGVIFKGKVEEAKGMDFVLIFDGEKFQLQKIDSMCNSLKLQRPKLNSRRPSPNYSSGRTGSHLSLKKMKAMK